MTRFLTSLLVAVAMLSGIAIAQTYPDYESLTVNDFAGLLSDETETEISTQLDLLREDTGIEMTVVTLSRKDMFAPDLSLEEFAAGLFDQWGIGHKTRNDGILFLVLLTDRESRIELGKGYAGEWQFEANWVMDNAIIPEFKNGNYESGIKEGVDETIRKIARPFHAGAAPPDRGGDGAPLWWFGLIFVPIGLVIFGRTIKDKLASMRRCPKCGQRTLSIERHTLEAATRAHSGRGERTTHCTSCDYHDTSSYTISRISSSKSSSSSFGGGSSGGGGASGRW
ncbi:TPM domain-containing protein [Alisedimentitalea sp. MJ-SS2]|uniref:TPM domain-containing protein n=1 Tax=Aliisedimentitalea sp. MJ-SS2 TaxID=3049795 RepID=UPI00290A832B|nr:TPM domain-containing protein [Alisedimentitalea sp. MJ-SS2]MDU8926648.1 TPM domain-containing protein [Alisedimentitalea sp. MJ-SS2]